MGHSPFPLLRIVVHAETQAVVRVPADGALDGALVLGDVAPDDGGIDAVDGMDEELVGEVRLRLRILGDHQQAAGVLVDTVHEHAQPLVRREVREHVAGEDRQLAPHLPALDLRDLHVDGQVAEAATMNSPSPPHRSCSMT